MKIRIVLLSAVVFLCGCKSAVSEAVTMASATLAQTEDEFVFTVSTVYPDGTEYISTDNGETWYADGKEAEKPIVCFAAHSENIYDMSHELYLIAEANGESFNYGKEPCLYDFTDDEYNLLYDYAYTQEALLLMDGAKTPLSAYDPEMAEDVSSGEYRYIKEFSDGQSVYTCCFRFYMG